MSKLLGEVHFEELPTGKVRCTETGHEMPASEKEGYSQSKKCRRALLDLCLSQQKPPLNVFEQCPTSKDKVICKLTGDILNKTEDALWKHMSGKKFQRKLAQKEAERNAAPDQKRETPISVKMEVDDERDLGMESCNFNDAESMDCEEPGFWIPPTDFEEREDADEMPLSNGIDQTVEIEFKSVEETEIPRTKRKAKKGASRPTLKKKKKKPTTI